MAVRSADQTKKRTDCQFFTFFSPKDSKTFFHSGSFQNLVESTLAEKPNCVCCAGAAETVYLSRWDEKTFRGQSDRFVHPVCIRCCDKIRYMDGRKLTFADANKKLTGMLGESVVAQSGNTQQPPVYAPIYQLKMIV